MLENYKKHENGVIEQIIKNKFNYTPDYVIKSYDAYGEITHRMSYLRLGHLIESLGYIPNSVLDVGYGNGSFLQACSNIIPSCYGSDVSNYKLPSNIQFIDNIYESEFDVVTFYDVLEHFESIYDIKNLKTKYIVISLPDCHYFSDEWFNDWKHRRPDEHFWHFNKQSLINFMLELGYTCTHTSNIEDTIRKNNKEYSNILTAVFKK